LAERAIEEIARRGETLNLDPALSVHAALERLCEALKDAAAILS